ncbi:hypothetical protein SRABI27_00615 [Pedobacter sp. Bi27]|nr:hypothetical protein SRABI27_00615 [Pedobacter sp. Bi27]
MTILVVFLIFFFKNLIAKQEEYAIVADENEITFLNWELLSGMKSK